MKNIGLIAAFILLPCFSIFALAADQPRGEETLVVPPYPADAPWKKITDIHNTQQIWIEWIPADQSPSDVHDILTEQAFYTQKGQSASDFVSGIFKRVATTCAGISVNGPTVQTENGYAVAYGQIYCVGQKDVGKDIDIFIKAITGKDALYIVQREFRRPAVPGAVPGMRKFPKGQLAEAQAALLAQKIANDYLVSQVQLCPPATGNGPCPTQTTSANPPVAAPSTQATSPANPAPSMDDPGPDDMSARLGLTPGKSTTDDVENKLGSNYREIPGPSGHFEYMYAGETVITICLFKKGGILVRTMMFTHG